MNISRATQIPASLFVIFLSTSAMAATCSGGDWIDNPFDYPTGMISKKVYVITSNQPIAKANFQKTYENLSKSEKLESHLIISCWQTSNRYILRTEGGGTSTETGVCFNHKTGHYYNSDKAGNAWRGGYLKDEYGNTLSDAERYLENGLLINNKVQIKSVCDGTMLTSKGVSAMPPQFGGYIKTVNASLLNFNKDIQANKMIVIETYTPFKATPKAQVSPY